MNSLVWERVGHSLRLRGFPFFDSTIELKVRDGRVVEYRLWDKSDYIRTATPEKLQQIVLERLKEGCEMYISSGFGSPHIQAHFSSWCGNHGYGKYTHNKKHLKYYWVNGCFIPSSSVSNEYTIRYSRELYSPSEAFTHTSRVIKRHCKRFLRLV
mgnify:FL=1